MSDSDEDIPSSEECQKLCVEFATLTNTDTACAQFYLQDRKWDLNRAVSAFFDAQNCTDDVKLSRVGDDSKVVIKFDALAAARAMAAATGSNVAEAQKIFKIMTWNIDGLDDRSLKQRTKGVCNTIKRELPDVVFLQELVPESFSYIESHLDAYKCIPQDDHAPKQCNDNRYFVGTLLRINSAQYNSHKMVPFPGTSMDRGLLIVKAKFGDSPLELINSHLESTKAFERERILQLRTSFKMAFDCDPSNSVFFGGDLNLRDKELDSAGGIPPGFVDLYEACGSRPECMYTWDLTRNTNLVFPGRFKPRMRFDRVYYRPALTPKLKPKHFGLLGIERLKSCGRFPSDHWGILVSCDT